MATYDIVLTAGTTWVDSAVPAQKSVNLFCRTTYDLEYRTGSSQPSAASPGAIVRYQTGHPVTVGAGEKLWVRMPNAGPGSYTQVAIDA